MGVFDQFCSYKGGYGKKWVFFAPFWLICVLLAVILGRFWLYFYAKFCLFFCKNPFIVHIQRFFLSYFVFFDCFGECFFSQNEAYPHRCLTQFGDLVRFWPSYLDIWSEKERFSWNLQLVVIENTVIWLVFRIFAEIGGFGP